MRFKSQWSGLPLLSLLVCLQIAGVLVLGFQEASVRPGINERWKSSNIEPLVGMLESESREIYTQREQIAGLVNPLPGAAVADIGAGSGFMVQEFARMVGPGGTIYAVDINSKLLERIDEHSAKLALGNIRTVLASDDSTGLPPDSLDLVFICDTYHHFEYPQRSLRSILQALRPGGEMVLVDFRRIPGESRDWVFGHVRGDKALFSNEITAAGFELVREHEAPFLQENYVLRFRKPGTGAKVTSSAHH